ncbi:sulfatase-like hydrolase/transferase [Halococcus saccharolyticus]|nr:sulfatase-like hydrolase/transferase [Halococcus saccharolyticus]
MTNVAVVVLDTLRKDAFDRHFDWLPGLRFENAYATANWTVPSHASLFTGQYASEVGVHAKNMTLDCGDPTLAEQLRAAGYTTRAFSANTNVTGYFDFDRGFEDFRAPKQVQHLNDDTVFDFREFSRDPGTSRPIHYLELLYAITTGDSATIPSLAALARKAIGKKVTGKHNGVEYGGLVEARRELADIEFGEQEFLFCNFMETHEPYRVPPEYRSVDEPGMTESVGGLNFGTANTEQTKQAYEDCARYLSDAYRKLFDQLRTDFEYVITLSDHGELLGEYDAWGHEHGVYPSLTHVPLTISGGGLDGDCTETVSLLDVHATVLDIANVESDSRGRTLLEEVDGRELLTEYHGLTSWSEEKLAENGYDDQIERYDRSLRGYASSSNFYGYETLDGFTTTGSEQIDDPKRQLRRLVADLDIRDVEADNEIPAAIEDQLEHLGYA